MEGRSRSYPSRTNKPDNKANPWLLSRKVGPDLRAVRTTPSPTLLRSLKGEPLDRPPIWFMRQAGRFLPEYRELRARAPDFMAFCRTPGMAAEATAQPLRRFPFDAAIVFADILLVPEALGQKVWFEAGEGPRLGDLPSNLALAAEVEASTERLSYVGETLGRVRSE